MSQDWYVQLGCPTRGIAPMVDGSDLPYRILTRKYGTDLSWTPMHNTNNLRISSKAIVQLIEELQYGRGIDQPLVLQLSGNNPLAFREVYETLVQKGVGDCFNIVELNMGCPQAIALRGRYGAYLMNKLDIAEDILRMLVAATESAKLGHKVAVKTRLSLSPKDTVTMCKRLCDTGVGMLSLHGRTRLQRTGSAVGPPDWQAIADVFSELRNLYPHVIFFANGGVWNLETHNSLCELTGCHGTISASMLIENAGVYVCRNRTNQKTPDVKNLARMAADLWIDESEMLKMLQCNKDLQRCEYVASKAAQEFPLDSPLYADVIKEWMALGIAGKEAQGSSISVQLAEASLEQRKIRVLLALEYLLIAKDIPQFVTVSQLISHTMRLVGRDLAAANVDLRSIITTGGKEQGASTPSNTHDQSQPQCRTEMCGNLVRSVLELYNRLSMGFCCLMPLDHSSRDGV